MSNSNPVKIAEEAVRYYIGAAFDREYSYDCNVNPEMLSDAELGKRLGDAFTEMLNALAALKDEDAAGVLDRVQQRDHDGSLFAVVMLDDVRRHRVANSPATQANAPERPPLERTTDQPPKPGTCAT
jgi:hypothetical protein